MRDSSRLSGWRRSAMRAAAVCVALASLLLAVAHHGVSRNFVGTPLPTRPAPALKLIDDGGQPFDLRQLRGQAVLVYFGYTHCPGVCPDTLSRLAPVFRALGRQRQQVAVVFVTLDPDRDTPAVLHRFLAGFNPIPIGLTGPEPLVATTARAWHIAWQVAAEGAFIDHASVMQLVDPAGRLRARYGLGQMTDPAAVARDIRYVLAG